MPDLLSSYLNAQPEKHGLPAHFHLALLQSWFIARAEGKAYSPAQPDVFLRDYLLSHLNDEKAALFLSDALIAYLNAPAPIQSPLPLTTFMKIIHDALGPNAKQFDLSQVAGCAAFYRAFMIDLAAAYHFPAELMPEALGQVLARANIPVPAAPGAKCRVLRETDFKGAVPAFTSEVTLVGPADVENGLGAGLRYMADGMMAANVNFSIFNRYGSNRSRSSDKRYAAFETDRPAAPINILNFNSDMLAENLLAGGPEHYKGRYTIGYFLWESSRLSTAHKLGIQLVDEIWVPTAFMRELYAKETDKPVYLCGCVIDPVPPLPLPVALPDAFNFVFTYDSASRAARKNPLAVVKAFQKAFTKNENARLIIKTQNADRLTNAIEKQLYDELQQVMAADSRMQLINATWKAGEITGLLAAADCYISLHRCEGIGYGMAEAMGFGVPVIATNWSGNVDFTGESTAYPVPSQLVNIAPGQYHYADENTAAPHQWAEPDIDKAAAIMHHVFTHQDEAAQRGKAGQALMKSQFTAAFVGARMKARITEITKGLKP